MSEWLSPDDRDEALYVLKQRLQPHRIREILDRDVERLVVTTERVKGQYRSRLTDDELAGFLIDLHGIDLLQNSALRAMLAQSLNDDQLEALASWGGEELAPGRSLRIAQVAERRWVPGKQWSRHFASTLGFPEIFAGAGGSPAAPATEEIDPYIPLPPLHDYQLELVHELHAILAGTSSHNRALLSLPTGSGKTRTVVEAILTWWGRNQIARPYLVWIAQSDELCEQAIEAFRGVWVDCGGRGLRKTLRLFRCWGQYRALPEGYTDGVVVASIQKLHEMIQSDDGLNELSRLAEDTAVVIIDEAHHATAPIYTAVLETFGLRFGRDPNCPVSLIGLTATPYRGSDVEENRRLARRFQNRLLVPTSLGDDPIRILRERGVLSQIDHHVLNTGRRFELTDAEAQRYSQLGQLPDSFLRKVGQDTDRNALLLRTLKELPHDWPVLLFGCSVDHARALAVLLRRAGRSAAVVTSDTRRATRRHLIEEFRAGRIQVLSNYGVLTTGFDAPIIRAVVIARPTTSVVLYEQMIGRGMRGPLNGGTEICTIIDLADNIARFQGQMAYVRMQEFWR